MKRDRVLGIGRKYRIASDNEHLNIVGNIVASGFLAFGSVERSFDRWSSRWPSCLVVFAAPRTRRQGEFAREPASRSLFKCHGV